MRRRCYRPYAALSLAMLGALALGAAGFSPTQVVGGNVWGLGVPLAGLSPGRAVAVVTEKARELEQGRLTFVAGALSCQALARDLGLVIDDGALASQLQECVVSQPRLWAVASSGRGPRRDLALAARLASVRSTEVLDQISRSLSRPPSESHYAFQGRDLQALPAQAGRTVTGDDVARSLQTVSGPVVEVGGAVIPAPSPASLEPLALVAEYSTRYDPAQTDRNVNLALAAGAVQGRVLRPGEEYSFNAAAGERTQARGYRYADVVVGDRLAPGLGGGICQVTTTLFNAAALAGLAIAEVHNHTIPADYAPPGRDAAVSWGALDLVIKNGTPSPVVLGAWVEDGEVTVRVFGRQGETTCDLETVTAGEYPQTGKNPGLLVQTYRLEKRGGEVVGRALLRTSRYLPSPLPSPK